MSPMRLGVASEAIRLGAGTLGDIQCQQVKRALRGL
jgi:hypothetical protein